MRVLITGGLGFIGSNLAIKLVYEGANVTILDALIPGLGANYFNINPIKEKVKIIKADVRDKNSIEKAVKNKDIIFHLAGQTDHMRSIEMPYEDMDIRVNGTLYLLDACRMNNTSAKIIFSSTRGVYGNSKKFPVDEDAPTNPKSMYAITSLAAEKILKMYQNLYGMRHTTLRLSNIYGPRHQMKYSYGVMNYFIKQALSDKPITVMGAGNIKRDLLFVEDACDAFIECCQNPRTNGEVLNVGSGKAISFITLANKIKKFTNGRIKFIGYTKGLKQVEAGDFIADIKKIKSITRWQPKTEIDDGIKNTLDFYRKNKKYYW